MLFDPITNLRYLANKLQWYHSIPLGNGLVTQGKSFRDQSHWDLVKSHVDVSNKTVLDIGCWDGFFSFECKKAGASRVLATDHYCWSAGWGWGSQDGFLLAREALGLDVECLDIDPADITVNAVGTFDIVLMLCLQCHRPDSYDILKKACAVCHDCLVLETMIEDSATDKPAIFLIRADKNPGGMDLWLPNILFIQEVMKECHFSITNTVTYGSLFNRHIFYCTRDRT